LQIHINMPQASIGALVPDLLPLCFAYLDDDARSLAACERVSRGWRELLLGSPEGHAAWLRLAAASVGSICSPPPLSTPPAPAVAEGGREAAVLGSGSSRGKLQGALGEFAQPEPENEEGGPAGQGPAQPWGIEDSKAAVLCARYLQRLGGVPAAGSFHGDEEVAVSSVPLTESGPTFTHFTLTPGADYDSDRAIRSEYAFPAVANFADARQARSMPWYSQPTWPQVPRCHGAVPLVLARPTEAHPDGGRGILTVAAATTRLQWCQCWYFEVHLS
jgi:hypothetical protein